MDTVLKTLQPGDEVISTNDLYEELPPAHDGLVHYGINVSTSWI